MITKERFEELIELGETIWGVYDYSYSTNNPNKKVEQINLYGFYNYYKDVDEFIMYQGDYSMFFETKEDAEWYKEFGCIERTERLKLATWEEFISNTNGVDFYRINGDKISFHKVAGDKVFTMYDKNGKIHFEREWQLTKENYIIACRKAKELFLGKES